MTAPIAGANGGGPAPAPLGARVAGQGALLLAGLGASQMLSFLRNALVGHMLSKGDFGIAATLTLMLQMVDALSDLGADRLIVQAPDGDAPRLQAVGHTLLVGRGVLTGLLLLAAAPLLTHFFRLPDARWAFEAIAIVPVIRGFQHLDTRRAQRHLDNRRLMLVEVVPQAATLLLAYPMLQAAPGFAAVVWLSLLQAAMTLAASHTLAERPYRLAADRDLVMRFLVFGWPILASALPLAATFQGDRLVIGRLLGMEPLAAYSTAFMVTMVPGLIAAKIANALLLPLLAERRRSGIALAGRYRQACDATTLAASLYLAGFVVAGGAVLPVAFGRAYTGLGSLVGWLALMWALRMLQAVPGMALMASSRTRPLLVAGLIRAAALLPAYLAARSGGGLDGVAIAACCGEAASLAYIAWRAGRLEPGLAALLLSRAALLLPVGLVALAAVDALPRPDALAPALAAALLLGAGLAAAALTLSTTLRDLVRPLVARALPA